MKGRLGITFTAAVVGSLLTALLSPSARADGIPAPLTDPGQAAVLVAELGDDRTAGIIYDDGRLIVAVTDQTAAESVRNAGGTAKIVPHSMAMLDSIHAELDKFAGVPNTAWGIDPSSNQVYVEFYEGVPAADRTRLEEAASAHGDAVSIRERSGKLEEAAYEMRGGVGITSSGGTCSSAFNVTDDSGNRFMLTAGHCVVGGSYDWYRRNGGIYLGTQIHFESEPGDWAIIDYRNSEVIPYGTIQYKDGSAGQITNSRPAEDGEKVKRVGTMSQDLDGMVLDPSVTVNYDDGSTYYEMIKTSLCGVRGDSGGALFAGTTALGITSGGSYVDEPCGNTDGQSDRVTYYQPVYKVIIPYDLEVY